IAGFQPSLLFVFFYRALSAVKDQRDREAGERLSARLITLIDSSLFNYIHLLPPPSPTIKSKLRCKKKRGKKEEKRREREPYAKTLLPTVLFDGSMDLTLSYPHVLRSLF
ncbi:hypothetical protein F2P56_018904, partial [Juglans regia]